MRDRDTNKIKAVVVDRTDKETLHRVIENSVKQGAEIFTDEFKAYQGLENHEHFTIRHSLGEYSRFGVHTNGIENFWSLLKRAYVGTYHYISEKHLQRYINEFSGRHNIKNLPIMDQVSWMFRHMAGKRLKWRDLAKE